MSSMILDKGNGVKSYHICPTCPRNYPIGDEGAAPNTDTIPNYHSEQQAKDAGWRQRLHLTEYALRPELVWVCPDCWLGDAP